MFGVKAKGQDNWSEPVKVDLTPHDIMFVVSILVIENRNEDESTSMGISLNNHYNVFEKYSG